MSDNRIFIYACFVYMFFFTFAYSCLKIIITLKTQTDERVVNHRSVDIVEYIYDNCVVRTFEVCRVEMV